MRKSKKREIFRSAKNAKKFCGWRAGNVSSRAAMAGARLSLAAEASKNLFRRIVSQNSGFADILSAFFNTKYTNETKKTKEF